MMKKEDAVDAEELLYQQRWRTDLSSRILDALYRRR